MNIAKHIEKDKNKAKNNETSIIGKSQLITNQSNFESYDIKQMKVDKKSGNSTVFFI